MGSRDNATAVASTGLGRRIREARVTQGMTQGDLAGSEFSVGFVSRIESGARQPSRHTLSTLAKRLGVSPEFLLTGAEAEDALARRHDVDRAELALAGGDIDEAVAITAELLENADLSPWPDLARRSRLVHALCYEAMGDLHSAIMALEDLAATYDADEEGAKVGIALSRCYRVNGDYRQSIESGERILRRMELLGISGTTEHIRLSMTVSAAYFESGELGVATRMARRAIKAAEANASPEAQAAAYWNASVYEREAGNIERAVELGQQALSILETGNSTRNLARMRAQLAWTYLRSPNPLLDDVHSLLELAEREMQWSSASPVDRARNSVIRARLALCEGHPDEAVRLVGEIPLDVCHQEPEISGEIAVVKVLSRAVTGAPVEASFHEAATLLDLLGSDRGIAQMWFELAEAASLSGLSEQATHAFRNAAICLGAARVMVPIYDRPAFRLPVIS